MRDLTPQEINDAPEWAVKYDVLESADDLIGYYGKGKALFVWSKSGVKSGVYCSYIEPAYAQPIPRKEFDIVTYDFFCGEIDYAVRSTSNNVVMVMTEPVDCLKIGKQDAIALAKHFKVTAEDLK